MCSREKEILGGNVGLIFVCFSKLQSWKANERKADHSCFISDLDVHLFQLE